jgi:hypothetical protein
VVGISGSLNFAKTIKEEIKEFLYNTLKLTLSEEKTKTQTQKKTQTQTQKTKISHLETEKVKYLGFLISRRKRRYTESQLSIIKSGKGKDKTKINRRPSYATVIVEAPIDTLINKLVEQGYA